MKIGIMTFHRAQNIGAVLQASALVAFLCNEGYDAELIDFYPNNGIPNKSLIRTAFRSIKRAIFYNKYKPISQRERKFDLFEKENYRISNVSYCGDSEIKANPPRYDVLISGSDQILNTTLTANSTSYYLDFSNETKKISYASSFGREEISENEISLIRTELIKFSNLSFREKSARNIVKNIIGIDGYDVLDPVFLVDKYYWEKRCNKELILPNKYIFVYAMEMTDGIKNVVMFAHKKFNLPVIVVNGSGIKNDIYGKEDKTCGPKEFIRYIRDAEFVITNSFHGTAFALIFEKKMFCVAHSKRNTRLENLLEYMECKEKQILPTSKNIDYESNIINSNSDYGVIHQMINNSKNYLKKALE